MKTKKNTDVDHVTCYLPKTNLRTESGGQPAEQSLYTWCHKFSSLTEILYNEYTIIHGRFVT